MKYTHLASLKLSLHQAALRATEAIDAIPADASVDDELQIIEAASAEANDIAAWIASLQVEGKRAEKIKARAQAWLDGTYWLEVA
ncbi:hypothetical protein NKY68_18040 [Sinorhizobium meliloti]|uniref:hypothetical protein n=1 Tax=Rhizobium meliloti TaxID=382 RepID=UPI000FDBB60B|nr:hypothetical protein [Sinorhizobium meliloti]MDX0318410.1 hypothetical protein [Sinorhizobium meliloti]MDX0325140.1 hypothetical protein [Sinorhizobium meliloti]MDX0983301.1 hypothetical protein [Sinorhizobium medicae]RVI69355.1 hypothetical protein CN187_09145 [Sinorhizobium meliloti]